VKSPSLLLLVPIVAVLAAAPTAVPRGQASYEQDLAVRTSRIPHAGNGVFTAVAIPKGAYLGAYGGELITEEEFLRRAGQGRGQYMMGLLACATPHTGGLATVDGIDGNVFTRMNYAPPDLQNVKFEKVCDAPFVKIVALRDIAAGEELWVDYGPRYRYDFMNDPAVIAFFAEERARRGARDRTASSIQCVRP
jgi:SET domain-containing protein